jgi:hypothetical protein
VVHASLLTNSRAGALCPPANAAVHERRSLRSLRSALEGESGFAGKRFQGIYFAARLDNQIRLYKRVAPAECDLAGADRGNSRKRLRDPSDGNNAIHLG